MCYLGVVESEGTVAGKHLEVTLIHVVKGSGLAVQTQLVDQLDDADDDTTADDGHAQHTACGVACQNVYLPVRWEMQ